MKCPECHCNTLKKRVYTESYCRCGYASHRPHARRNEYAKLVQEEYEKAEKEARK